MGTLEQLQARYADRVDFYVIYIREAHPDGAWGSGADEPGTVRLPAARTAADRRQAAGELCRLMGASIPTLLDAMDDATALAYGAFPDRLYLVDRGGRVVHKGGRGPYDFDLSALERSIILTLLLEDAGAGAAARR